jgi:hypothetical protein
VCICFWKKCPTKRRAEKRRLKCFSLLLFIVTGAIVA